MDRRVSSGGNPAATSGTAPVGNPPAPSTFAGSAPAPHIPAGNPPAPFTFAGTPPAPFTFAGNPPAPSARAGNPPAPFTAPTTRPNAGSRRGPARRANRRRLERAFESYRQEQAPEIPIYHRDADMLQSRLPPLAPGTVLLPEVLGNQVVFQRRARDSSLLETPDERINFVAIDNERKPVNSYVMKVHMDTKSLDAAYATITELGWGKNARYLNLTIEFEDARTSARHRQQLAQMRRESDARVAATRTSAPMRAPAEARRAADTPAPVRAPAETTRAAESTQIKQEPDMAANTPAPAPTQAEATRAAEVTRTKEPDMAVSTSAPAPLTCAHCKKPGHISLQCAVPNLNYGSVLTCPVCNDSRHHFDECPQIASKDPNDDNFAKWLYTLICEPRQNMPQIRSTKWGSFDVITVGIQRKIFKLDRAVPRVWPWSNTFAMQVGKAKPGDPILQGKLHPSEFDPERHRLSDLPEDPKFRGKSINDIMAMRERGELDAERFIPRRMRAAAEKPAMIDVGAATRDAENRVAFRPRAEAAARGAADGALIKQESYMDTEMSNFPPARAAHPGTVRNTYTLGGTGNVPASESHPVLERPVKAEPEATGARPQAHRPPRAANTPGYRAAVSSRRPQHAPASGAATPDDRTATPTSRRPQHRRTGGAGQRLRRRSGSPV